jgi:hypothetical protein
LTPGRELGLVKFIFRIPWGASLGVPHFEGGAILIPVSKILATAPSVGGLGLVMWRVEG